jgi:hypothetical protein
MEVVDPAGKACGVLKTHRPHVVLNAVKNLYNLLHSHTKAGN